MILTKHFAELHVLSCSHRSLRELYEYSLTILTQDTLPQTETKAEDQKERYCSHRDQDSKCCPNCWEKQRKPKTILEHLFSITISPGEFNFFIFYYWMFL